jgi:LPXTG-motif cell wall-anchored protein
MGDVSATLSGAAVSVTIPPIRTTSCWERAELRVWNLDYERPTDLGYSLELLTTIPIEGRDFRGVTLGLGDLPAGDQDILVAIYGFDGDVQGSTRETIGEQIHLDVPDVSAEQYEADAAAYHACLAPNDGRIVKSKSGDVTASTTNGVMTVVLPSVETVDCLDSITFVIWAADYDRPTEDHPFVAVKLDEIVLDSSSYAGGTYSYPVTPGHVDAMVTIVGTLGVLEGGLEYLQYRAHVPQPGEGTTTTVSTTGGSTRGGSALAETGVETAGLVSGAAALLALGLVSLVVTRRRRSAQQS